MFQILYAIFSTKLDIDKWEGDINYIRAWLYIECTYFLSWIICGMIFLFFAYVLKFKSVCKNEKVMQMDDNVWNDKDTDDFLRYLKFEFFVMNYMISFLFTDFCYGFQLVNFLKNGNHSLYFIFGEVNFETTGVIFCIIVGCRLMHLFVTLYSFSKGENLWI